MNEGWSNSPIDSSRRTNACALLHEDEFRRLVEAAETYISAQAVLMSFLAKLGNAVHRGLTKIPQDWQDEITKTIRESLDFAQRVSTTRMQDFPGLRSSENFYTAMALATGVAGGAFGLPAILAELPITTGLILRSIADVGRSHGERLDDPEFAATCIEVFAFGGPLEEADDSDIAFIAARIGAIEVTDFIAKVAVRYASAIAPKIAAMSVPLVGAVLGAGVNWAYMRFYQSMAQVLFTLRPIERSHDPAQVRSCFASLVKELRERRTAPSRIASDPASYEPRRATHIMSFPRYK
jgi:hypothetical protein